MRKNSYAICHREYLGTGTYLQKLGRDDLLDLFAAKLLSCTNAYYVVVGVVSVDSKIVCVLVYRYLVFRR